MKKLFSALFLGALLVTPSIAAETPAPKVPTFEQFSRGAFVEKIACKNDPSQTYTLYLPSAYNDKSKWPVLFIFDPRGRSVRAGEIFREAVERYGWIILSSDNTRSDGGWEPNVKAVDAMWPELKRYASDPQRIYATGFSGGALVAWQVGQQTGALAGVISSGSRPENAERPDSTVRFAHYGAAGEAEFNYQPTLALDSIAAKAGAPHRFEAFKGPHAWMPPEIAREAVEWMELQAMRTGTRPADRKLVLELFQKDFDKAKFLESAGKILEAKRRYDSIARTFRGLIETSEVELRMAGLANSADLKRALKQEKAALDYELTHLALMSRAIDGLKGPKTPPGADRMASELRVSVLQKVAQENSYKGLAARRALNSYAAFLSFYLPRDFLASRDFERAAVVLELATRIDNNQPVAWYNLACAWAQTGKPDRAIEALSRAVDVGYRHQNHFESDADLDPLRSYPKFADIADRVRKASEQEPLSP